MYPKKERTKKLSDERITIQFYVEESVASSSPFQSSTILEVPCSDSSFYKSSNIALCMLQAQAIRYLYYVNFICSTHAQKSAGTLTVDRTVFVSEKCPWSLIRKDSDLF